MMQVTALAHPETTNTAQMVRNACFAHTDQLVSHSACAIKTVVHLHQEISEYIIEDCEAW